MDCHGGPHEGNKGGRRGEDRGRGQREGNVKDATMLALKQEESQVKGFGAFLEDGKGKGTNSSIETQKESTMPDSSISAP